MERIVTPMARVATPIERVAAFMDKVCSSRDNLQGMTGRVDWVSQEGRKIS